MGDKRGFWANLAWGDWLYGLIAAAIGGGSGAVGAAVGLPMIDPDHFAAGTHKWMVAIGVLFLSSAAAPFFAYLKQKPLPDKIITETTVEKTATQANPPALIKTTVKTTEVTDKPAEPDKGD